MCCTSIAITVQVKVGDISTTANVSAELYAKIKEAILNHQSWEHLQTQNIIPLINSCQFGPPILMIAVQTEDVNSVETLLSLGAKPHQVYQGKNAIELAKELKNSQLMEILEK